MFESEVCSDKVLEYLFWHPFFYSICKHVAGKVFTCAIYLL